MTNSSPARRAGTEVAPSVRAGCGTAANRAGPEGRHNHAILCRPYGPGTDWVACIPGLTAWATTVAVLRTSTQPPFGTSRWQCRVPGVSTPGYCPMALRAFRRARGVARSPRDRVARHVVRSGQRRCPDPRLGDFRPAGPGESGRGREPTVPGGASGRRRRPPLAGHPRPR